MHSFDGEMGFRVLAINLWDPQDAEEELLKDTFLKGDNSVDIDWLGLDGGCVTP